MAMGLEQTITLPPPQGAVGKADFCNQSGWEPLRRIRSGSNMDRAAIWLRRHYGRGGAIGVGEYRREGDIRVELLSMRGIINMELPFTWRYHQKKAIPCEGLYRSRVIISLKVQSVQWRWVKFARTSLRFGIKPIGSLVKKPVLGFSLGIAGGILQLSVTGYCAVCRHDAVFWHHLCVWSHVGAWPQQVALHLGLGPARR
jgi:hypothetical protein